MAQRFPLTLDTTFFNMRRPGKKPEDMCMNSRKILSGPNVERRQEGSSSL